VNPYAPQVIEGYLFLKRAGLRKEQASRSSHDPHHPKLAMSLLRTIPVNDLPPMAVAERRYSMTRFVFGMFCSQIWPLGTFLGIFLPSLDDPNGPKWWALCFIGSLFSSLSWLLFLPKAVTRRADGFTIHRVLGGVKHIPMACIESVALVQGCCGGPSPRLNLKQEFVEMEKQYAGCCACCVKSYVSLRLDSVPEFALDHGMGPASLSVKMVELTQGPNGV
jgi:hypothetical protein